MSFLITSKMGGNIDKSLRFDGCLSALYAAQQRVNCGIDVRGGNIGAELIERFQTCGEVIDQGQVGHGIAVLFVGHTIELTPVSRGKQTGMVNKTLGNPR